MFKIFKKIFQGLYNPRQSIESGDNSTNIQVGRDLNIFLNDNLLKELRLRYNTIFTLLKTQALNEYKKFGDRIIGSSQGEKVIHCIKNLPYPDKATHYEIFKVIENILGGILGWAATLKYENENLYQLAYEISQIGHDYHFEELKNSDNDKDFRERGSAKAKFLEPILKEIDEKNLNRRNLGGMNAFLQTIKDFNKRYKKNLILTPKLLGFEKISDPDALVNLALEEKISISNIELINLDKDPKSPNLIIKFKVKNNTDIELRYFIPKGQIFENKDYQINTQNFALANQENESISANSIKYFEFNAFCLNHGLDAPIETVIGNITIFKVEDESFVNQDDLWAIMQKNKDLIYKIEYQK